MNFQMFKLDLEKAEETEIRLPTSVGSSKKQESSINHLLLLYWLCQSSCLCGSQQTGKFFKRWEYQTTLPASWEMCMQVRKQQLELDMERDWFKIGKGVCQGYILSHCLFNLYAEYIMRNAGLDEHKLESRFPGEISITSYMQMTPPLWQKAKKN